MVLLEVVVLAKLQGAPEGAAYNQTYTVNSGIPMQCKPNAEPPLGIMFCL